MEKIENSNEIFTNFSPRYCLGRIENTAPGGDWGFQGNFAADSLQVQVLKLCPRTPLLPAPPRCYSQSLRTLAQSVRKAGQLPCVWANECMLDLGAENCLVDLFPRTVDCLLEPPLSLFPWSGTRPVLSLLLLQQLQGSYQG